MKKIFYCLVAALVLVACVKEDVSIAKIEEVKNPYAVTPDEAVQLLKTVIGGESTRAVSVGEIKTLRKSDFVPTTRGGEDGDVIYIVDLENGGSAVMGADKRMEPIYAILDETKISPEKLTLTATRTDDGEQDIEEYVMGLLNAKISSDFAMVRPPLDTLPIPSLRPDTWTVTTTLGQKSPMLRTKWRQGQPFNNVIAMHTNNNDTPAGCVTIAVGQIMAYHQRNMTGSNFNWNIINSFEYGYDVTATPGEITYMANYIYEVRTALSDRELTNHGISTSELVEFMRTDLGYHNVSCIAYNLNNIYSMLNYDNPVCINGTSTCFDGRDYEPDLHTWIIDGYHYYKVEDWERTYIGDFISDEHIVDTYYYNILHCNYGYSGACDGYYTEGIFDLRVMRTESEVDSSVGDVQSSILACYNTNLSIIQYSK